MTSLLSVIFFFFNQRTSITVVKKKDPPCCSPNQGLAISAQLSLAFQKHQEESRWRILTERPGDGAPRPQAVPHTCTCKHTHAHRQSRRGPGPQAPGPCPHQPRQPGPPHFLRDKSCRGLGAPQIPQANTQVKQHHLPCKGLFKCTRHGRSQATKPALSDGVNLCPRALWGGNLWPPLYPLLPLLLAYPGMSFPQPGIRPRPGEEKWQVVLALRDVPSPLPPPLRQPASCPGAIVR